MMKDHSDPTFSDMFLDLVNSLKILKKKNEALYYTLVNVFVNGMPIQDYAINNGVTPRMITYRLTDGLDLLTNIMNGDVHEG
jgi:hypothetical protein